MAYFFVQGSCRNCFLIPFLPFPFSYSYSFPIPIPWSYFPIPILLIIFRLFFTMHLLMDFLVKLTKSKRP